jgi:hypothetical protein
MFFLLFLLNNGRIRIRIRISDYRIRELQKTKKSRSGTLACTALICNLLTVIYICIAQVHIPADKLVECGDCQWVGDRVDNLRYHIYSQVQPLSNPMSILKRGMGLYLCRTTVCTLFCFFTHTQFHSRANNPSPTHPPFLSLASIHLCTHSA